MVDLSAEINNWLQMRIIMPPRPSGTELHRRRGQLIEVRVEGRKVIGAFAQLMAGGVFPEDYPEL